MSEDSREGSNPANTAPISLAPPLAPGVDWSAIDPGPLWSGGVTVETSGKEATGEGHLTRVWSPAPVLQLVVTTDEDWAIERPAFAPEGLAVQGGEITGWIPTRLSGPFEPVTRTFHVTDMVVGDSTAACTGVRFAVANFPRFVGSPLIDGRAVRADRLELDAGSWHFRLDGIGIPDLHEQMTSGGRVLAVTHIGLLTRSDEEAISYAQAEEALRAFSLWASLLRGAYTSPVVMIGEVADGSTVWVRHLDWYLDPWSAAPGVLPRPLVVHDRSETLPALARSLNRVMELLADPDWADIFGRVTLWYLTANAGQTDGDLILAQAGLELLAYATIVLGGHLTVDGFSRLNAADQFQLLLTIHGLDLAVPPDLKRLDAYARSHQRNAPQVVTEFRNRVVHPPTKKSRPAEFGDPNALIEAKMLSLQLLERAILATVAYDGVAFDRPSRSVISLHR